MIKATYKGQKNITLLKTAFDTSRRIKKLLRFKLKVKDGAVEYFFSPGNKREFRRYLSYFTKETGTISWMKNFLKADDVFFDIGANLGLYSIYAAKLGRRVKVYSFEPHKFNFTTLLENIYFNDLQDSVFPISVPLGDLDDNLIKFNYQSLDSGSAMGQLGHKQLPGERAFVPKFEEIVYSSTLDHMVERKIIPSPNAIKIDVDGNEMLILRGMVKTLSSAEKPRTVQVEANPGQKDELVEFMKSFGYKLDHSHFTAGGQELFDKGTDINQIAHNLVFVA